MSSPVIHGIFWHRRGRQADADLEYIGDIYFGEYLPVGGDGLSPEAFPPPHLRAFRVEPMESILRGQHHVYVLHAFGEHLSNERRLGDAKRAAERYLRRGLDGLVLR